jgi:hypothetical protein
MGRRFELRIDHCGLKHLFFQQTLNFRKTRWLEFLSEYDFEIKHIKGKKIRWLMHLEEEHVRCIWNPSAYTNHI